MLSLVSRAHYHPPVFIQKKSFCKTANQDSRILNTLLIRHIEKMFPKIPKGNVEAIRSQVTYPIVKNVLQAASKSMLLKEEEIEVKADIQKSICLTMEKIRGRIPGSKKGVMYGDQYAEEVLGIDYLDYLAKVTRNKNAVQHPNFKSGTDVLHFITKTGVKASDAIDSFLEGPTAADCATLVEAVYFKAIQDVIGKEKFDGLFHTRKEKLQIRKWVCPDEKSSLYPFIEFVNPHLFNETCISQLEIGAHVCIAGVPGFSIKRPLNNLQNMHGLVVGYDEERKPLISGIEFNTPQTIDAIMQELVDAWNAPQSPLEIQFYEQYGTDYYLSPKHLDKENSQSPLPKNLPENHFSRQYSVGEVKKLGGCKLYNEHTCRLSTFVLSSLKRKACSEISMQTLQAVKAVTLGRHILSLAKNL
jgi:hypothetical protein